MNFLPKDIKTYVIIILLLCIAMFFFKSFWYKPDNTVHQITPEQKSYSIEIPHPISSLGQQPKIQPRTESQASPAGKKSLPIMIPATNDVWRTVDPGGSGGTLSYAMHPLTGTILVSSDMYGSLLRSLDNAKTFHPIAPEGHPTIVALAPHPDKKGVWYAGFGLGEETGLFKSEDDGESWTFIHKDSRIASRTSFGLVIAGKPEQIIWNFKDKGPMLSMDDGKTFVDFHQGLLPGNMYGEYEPTAGRNPIILVETAGKTILFIACKDGLYRRALTDIAWERVKGFPPGKVISIAYDKINRWVWAGFHTGDIYSGDLGTGVWEKASHTPPVATILRTHPDKPGWVWCFSHGRAGLFRSKDRGKNWEWLTRKLIHNGPEYKGNTPKDFRSRTKFTRDYFFIHPQNANTLPVFAAVHASQYTGIINGDIDNIREDRIYYNGCGECFFHFSFFGQPVFSC